jgi:hypothetical protein
VKTAHPLTYGIRQMRHAGGIRGALRPHLLDLAGRRRPARPGEERAGRDRPDLAPTAEPTLVAAELDGVRPGLLVVASLVLPYPGLGGRLAVTELLAQVGGSSVNLNCPCADQGGRNVDMVVGADHHRRAGIGVWHDAATGPLTALPTSPVTDGALLGQADGLAA